MVDIVILLKAAVMGVVEGLTEFLPISSTGHLILAGTLLDFHDERGKLFEIVIQSGAILAVVWEYRARIAATFGGLGQGPEGAPLCWSTSAIAFLPIAAARPAGRQGAEGASVQRADGGDDLHPRCLRDPVGRAAPAQRAASTRSTT